MCRNPKLCHQAHGLRSIGRDGPPISKHWHPVFWALTDAVPGRLQRGRYLSTCLRSFPSRGCLLWSVCADSCSGSFLLDLSTGMTLPVPSFQDSPWPLHNLRLPKLGLLPVAQST